MNSHKAVSNESLIADIVVIGGGGAGLAAAVSAGEKGAKVIVLEKRSVLGGNTALAEGLLAAESPAQKRLNIDAPRDELFKMAMTYARWRINPRIVRAFINKSGDTIQWLEDKGLFFDWIPPLYPGQRYLVWHCLRRSGKELIEVLTKACGKLGVQIFNKSETKKLVTDAKGNVTGVVAVTGEKEIRITAKSVIIATGGYGGNKKLLKKYNPFYNEKMIHHGLPHMGDGILMAIEAGAATEGLGLIHFSGHSPSVGSTDLTAVSDEPNTIWVNKKGERFIDEAAAGFSRHESVNAIVGQPDGFGYTLFDDRIRRNIEEKGIIKGLGHFVPAGTQFTGLEKTLESAAKKGVVKIASSWENIATWIGIEPEKLLVTIDEYNLYCEQRYDEIFAKDPRYLEALRTPPYYAIEIHPRFIGTIGGIKINHHMEVLDHNDNPIHGLYAAGIDTGGWEGDTYNGILSGSTFGFAINSGRIAGENAVEHILGK
ncbi:FAD-dependent oxidoreductase [Chloroflexota bacterium]